MIFCYLMVFLVMYFSCSGAASLPVMHGFFCSNHLGYPPHRDQFDGMQLRQSEELLPNQITYNAAADAMSSLLWNCY